MTDDSISEGRNPPQNLKITRAKTGRDGVSRQALKQFLGCSFNVLKEVLSELDEEPVGRSTMLGTEYPLYDWTVALRLAEHPAIIESKRRSDATITPKKRTGFLADFASSWEIDGAELIALTVGPYKSVRDHTLPLEGCTVLIGANGAGKTNILEAIAVGGNRHELLSRLRPQSDATGATPTRRRAVGRLTCKYKLRAVDQQELETFLDRFLQGKGTKGPFGDRCRQLLTAIFEHPTVAIVHTNHETSTWILAGPKALELRETAQELAAMDGPRDPWIRGLVAAAQNATELTPMALLPLHEPSKPPHVEILDADPVRLATDLTAEVPKLAQSLWGPHRREEADHGLHLALALEELNEMEDPGELPTPEDCPWITWLAPPEGTGLDRPTVLQACVGAPPQASWLRPPSARTRWLALGTGTKSVQNVSDIALLSNRAEVRALLRKASLLRTLWILAADTRDRAELSRRPESIQLAAQLESLFDGLGLPSPQPTPGKATWLTRGQGGLEVPSTVLATLSMIEESSNNLAPGFVRDHGRILISILPPETWEEGEPTIRLSFAGSGGRIYSLSQIGSGARRWIAASVREAVRRLRSSELELVEQTELRSESTPEELTASVTVVSGGPDDRPSILLVDEPEMSLHPLAQEQVAAWCVEASKSGQFVIIASHSPAVLDLPASAAHVEIVTMVNGETRVTPLELATLEGLDSLGKMIGLGRSGLLQLTRGFLLVEGPTDVRVLKALLGPDLDSQRIVPIPLHGVFRFRGVQQLEFLTALGKPVAVMFDSIRRAVLDGKRPPESNEENVMLRMLANLQERFPIDGISFDAPDIICALPDQAVKRVHPQFPGWETLLSSWDPDKGNFKNHALNELGLPHEQQQVRQLVEAALEAWIPTDPLPSAFARTAEELRAWADSISSSGWTVGIEDSA